MELVKEDCEGARILRGLCGIDSSASLLNSSISLLVLTFLSNFNIFTSLHSFILPFLNFTFYSLQLHGRTVSEFYITSVDPN